MKRSIRALAKAVIFAAGLACVANAQTPAVGGAAGARASLTSTEPRSNTVTECSPAGPGMLVLFSEKRIKQLRTA